MAAERVERRLAAILAADIAGSSRLMGADEVGTLGRPEGASTGDGRSCDRPVSGRIVKTTGDGLLAEFASAVDAVTCAVACRKRWRNERSSGVA